MSIFRLTDVADATRQSPEYWNKRNEDLWGRQMHGHFLDDPKLIEEMDSRNFKVLDQIFNDFCKVGKRDFHVLECACGIGRYTSHIVQKYLDYKVFYTGLDFASKNIEEAKHREKDNIKFYLSDMLSFKTEEKFDLIFMVAAMSSIEQNSKEIIDHLKTMLTANGVIAIFEQSVYCVVDNVGVSK